MNKKQMSFKILFFTLTAVTGVTRPARADEYTKLTGSQASSSLAFAAETAQIGRCQLSVTRFDNAAYSDSSVAAKITLTDGNGASDSIVIQPGDSFDAQDIVLSGAAIRVVTSQSGNIVYQRNSDLFFVQVAGIQCGSRF